MLKQIFGKRATTKADVILAGAAVIIAAVKFIDVKKQYSTEQDQKKEIEK